MYVKRHADGVAVWGVTAAMVAALAVALAINYLYVEHWFAVVPPLMLAVGLKLLVGERGRRTARGRAPAACLEHAGHLDQRTSGGRHQRACGTAPPHREWCVAHCESDRSARAHQLPRDRPQPRRDRGPRHTTPRTRRTTAPRREPSSCTSYASSAKTRATVADQVRHIATRYLALPDTDRADKELVNLVADVRASHSRPLIATSSRCESDRDAHRAAAGGLAVAIRYAPADADSGDRRRA